MIVLIEHRAGLPKPTHANLSTGTDTPRRRRQPATRVLPRLQGAGRLPAAGIEAAYVIGAPPVLDLLSSSIL